ncbi:MAG: cytochrome c oxidase subunit II [Vicinamibacteria bacterium]|jgi:cytochrome c oxidase subunit 2
MTYVRLVAAMLVVAAVTSVLLLQINWFGEAGSTQAGPIDTLFDVMIVLSCFVFAIVMVMFVYAIWKFRVKPGDEGDGKPIHGNTKLEIAWTVIPTIIVLFGAGYSWTVLDDIESEAANSMPLMVTAQQFEWTFQYPEKMVGSGDTATPVTTHQLHVPVDRQLAVSLTALDVLHSFWVPEWRIKRDLVPARDPSEEGVDNTFVVTPDVEGTFSLVCTELCGTGHATMRAPVVVESQEEFDRWLDEQARAQASTAGAGAAAAGDGT